MEPIETTGLESKANWRTEVRRVLTVRWPEVRSLLATTVNNWSEHNIPRLGASVAFYTLLSLAPLLVIIVAVASAAFGRRAAQGQLVWQIQDTIGREAAETVQELLNAAQAPGIGTLAAVLGSLALMYGATAVVAELRDALNTIWCVPKKPETGIQSLLAIVRDRTFAFATVLGIGFLLLISLAVNAALTALSGRYERWFGGFKYLLQSADLVISYVVIASLFTLLYKLLPDVHLQWSDVIPGALVTSALFSIGKVLIGIYLGTASIGSTYGAAGSLVVLLLWVYYSAQIFFLGAEFTQAWAQTFGSRPCDSLDKNVVIAATISEVTGPAVDDDKARVTLT
ncbi:MAG TPA: YihY/virulence factor BrkB family protein [Bryobacteraceae bacterium]|nr:YihY/virulence factor BrkB family protein [Bryobacteraceae bacterium]